MSIKRIIFLLFIVSIFFAKNVSAQLTNTSKRTIVVMGSSSAYGWKSSVPDSAWVYRLQKDLHFYNRGDTIIDIAYPGNTSYICLPTGSPHPGYAPASDPSYNVTTALSYNPTFVIISLPTNDIADGYSNAETLANYTTITNALTAAGVPFILTGTQPRDLATDATCSTAYDGASVCLSSGNLTPAQQADLATFNTQLTAQYPSNATYATPIVNNFLTLLSVSSSNYEINPTISYGDGIHYLDNGHRIVYNTFLSFQLYKDLVCFTQTITIPGPINKTLGSADFNAATASSGLAVTYTSSNPAVATIVGGLIHIVGVGSTTITASQAGNVHYLAAPTVSQTLNVTSGSGSTTTYDWTGAINTDWQTPGNWRSTTGGVTTNPATDYPGDGASTDIVNIGVNLSYTNSPVIATSLLNAVASLTFGDNLITGGGTTTDSLTVNTGAILSVTGQILQKHTSAGVLNSGNTAVVNAIQTYIKGGGTINCGSFAVGDSTTPTANGVVNITKVILGSAGAGSTINLNITGNLILNTQSSDNGGGTQILSTNDAQFSLAQGTITLGGVLTLTDGGATGFTGSLFEPASIFSIDLYNTADNPVLNLQNAAALSVQSGNVGNLVDFYNVVVSGGSGMATVNYTGNTNQRVYNYVSGVSPDSFVDNDAASGDFAVYQNLGFSGSGTKTVDAPSSLGTLILGAYLNIGAGTETVDLSANNCALLIGADFTQGAGATFTCGTRPVFISGSFYNSGTCNFGTSLITFNSGASEVLNTVSPVTFTNVAFTYGQKTFNLGNFFLSSQGVLTLSGGCQLISNGNFTLNSDATGSATIAAIPNDGSSITGDVNVQRYVTSHRAYRLSSSPVYTDVVGSNNVYRVDYIKNGIYVTGTGGTAGGFDKYGNPTLYLYRENLVPGYSTFFTSNFRGINNIASPPNYNLDVDGGPYNIPVGNGVMFYYRGSRNQGTLAAETTAGAPSTNDTLTSTGTLNQGAITVSNWYTPASQYLGYTTISGSVAIEGNNLVGNPYASSIDWDQSDSTNTAAGIYSPHVAPFAYQLIPTGAQGSGNYGVYEAGGGGSGGTNGATNIIASGVGFFVQATGASAQLVFNENAKTNTQAVVGSSLFMAKRLAAKVNNNPYLRIQFAKDSINSDESIIRFDAQATTAFNPIEDARYKSGTGQVSLLSISSDNAPLAINRVPFPKNNQALTIPLKIGTTGADGTYQFNLKTLNQVPQLYDIWLMDAHAKDSTNMRVSPLYNFSIAKADTTTYGSKRFVMVIRENPLYAYKLLTFTGQKVKYQKEVELTWTTQNEQNYTHFTVERSIDNGKTYQSIGNLLSSGLGTYNLADSSPADGISLYRLQSQDIDGNITYSNVITIDYSNIDNRPICLYPNPASDIIVLGINKIPPGKPAYNIRVSNSSGIVIKEAVTTVPYWKYDVNQLLTGTYLIEVVNNADNSLIGQAKFVKL